MEQFGCKIHPKDADGMANSVAPNQNAPMLCVEFSGLILFCDKAQTGATQPYTEILSTINTFKVDIFYFPNTE